MRAPFTVVSLGETHALEVELGEETVHVAPGAVSRVFGWELKPEGLCRGDTCIPIRDRQALAGANGVDLAAVAGALGQPLALDLGERMAVIGAAASSRGSELATLMAPDFSLPDLEGRLHSLSEHRGKKVLLIAYASW